VLLTSQVPSVTWGQAFDQHELQVDSRFETGDLAGAIFSMPTAGDFDGDR
jgi:hypothetical protein